MIAPIGRKMIRLVFNPENKLYVYSVFFYLATMTSSSLMTLARKSYNKYIYFYEYNPRTNNKLVPFLTPK